MSHRELLHRLLYLAFIEIREEAHLVGNKKVFHIADLFHTIPLQLERVLKEQSSYDDVLNSLYILAREKGLEEWFNHAAKASARDERKG